MNKHSMSLHVWGDVSLSVCAGDGVRGGGCCANLPVFFSQNSGLVAVVGRESASILPETMEDSLCSSLVAGPEVKMGKDCRLLHLITRKTVLNHVVLHWIVTESKMHFYF